MTRCPECGARARGAVRCPACGADLGEPLPVLDVVDAELGIRDDDRYAAIPPGPRLVPRRVHDESTRAPLVLLGVVVGFFLVGSWLDGAGSDNDRAPVAAPAPVLERRTGVDLLLVGDDAVSRLDVDAATARPVRRDAPDRALDVVAVGDALVVLSDVPYVLVADRPPRELPPADDVLPSTQEGRVWLVSAGANGRTHAREVGVTDGAVGAEQDVEGTVVGTVTAGLVVERPSGEIAVVDPGGSARVVAGGGIFLAAGGDTVASRSAACAAACSVTVERLEGGGPRVVRTELTGPGVELATFSADGRRLALARSDGLQTHGVLVDTRLDTVTPFRARGVPRHPIGAPRLAWSPDGAWLFVATERAGIDAVDSRGRTYRVDAELPEFDALVAAPG